MLRLVWRPKPWPRSPSLTGWGVSTGPYLLFHLTYVPFSVGGLWLVLISLAMLQASRGNGIWTKYVNHVDFFAPAPNTEVPMDYPAQGMVPQHKYVSQSPQQYTSQLPQLPAPQQPQFVAPPQQLQYMPQIQVAHV